MTDRPRVWTLVDFGDQIRAVGPIIYHGGSGRVTAVELDREKVEAVIRAALSRYQRNAVPRERSVKDCARFIFDALDPEG